MRITLFCACLAFGMNAMAADLAKGKALSVQCSVCHGKNGIAKDPESSNLAGQSAYYLEKATVSYTHLTLPTKA